MNKKDLPKDKKELEKLLETVTDEVDRADIIARLSSVTRTSNPEQALEYAQKAMEISKSIGYEKGIAKSYTLMGIISQYRGDYLNALEFYHNAKTEYEKAGLKTGVANSVNNIGIIYHQQGDYPRALGNYREALKILEEFDDIHGMAYCYGNIGNVYLSQKKYDQALDYYEKSLRLKRESKDSSGIANCLNNIGSVYQEKEDFKAALHNFHKALEIREEINDKIGVAYCRENIGTIYMFQGAYARAIEYLEKSLKLNEELGDKTGIASCNINMGRLKQHTGQWDEALEYLTKGLNKAIEIGSLDLKKEAYFELSRTYEELGDATKALKYFKFYKKTDDTLFGQEQTLKIAELENRFEFEKKEQEIEIWKKASVTDTLTNIANRQGIWRKIKGEMERAAQTELPITISLVDIDGFKKFNDVHGHDCGDSVLIKVANILVESVGDSGHVGRWGGEEFLIVLPETTIVRGAEIVEKARKNIANHVHSYDDKELSITASFGISEYREGDDMDAAIKLADEALYRAKKNGKNRCVLA